MNSPSSAHYELFALLEREAGLILTDSELDEIELAAPRREWTPPRKPRKPREKTHTQLNIGLSDR